MKEQEVLCFDVGQNCMALNDGINERVALLNAAGKRVINIIFHEQGQNWMTVCLLCEKE